MLRKVAVSLATLLATSCATASPRHTDPVPFEVASAGDDGLTQRVVAGLRAKLGAMSQFREAPRSPGTLTIVIPNVSSKQAGNQSRVSTAVTFSRLSKAGELVKIKEYRTACPESDLSQCFDQIARTALKL